MIAFVLVAHGLVLLGLVRMPMPPVPDLPDVPSLQAILIPPPAPPKPPPPRPRPVPPAQPTPVPAPRPAAEPAPETPPQQAPAPALATAPTGETATNTGSGGAGTASAAAASAPVAPAPAEPPAPRYTAPPSATLRYASFVNGVQNPDGLIRWEQDGAHYRLAVETRVLWFRFAFQSTGAMGERGLAPERYEENKRGKVQATRIDRAAGVVAFESRGNQVPITADTQDRFSIFLQLVGWVRGDPRRYATPGVTEAFHVADTSDLEPIQVQYVSEEDVDLGNGQSMTRTKHFVRLPRHPGDKRRVEIWLAPALGWMPARLRQTEPDGTQIDLIYRGTDGR